MAIPSRNKPGKKPSGGSKMADLVRQKSKEAEFSGGSDTLKMPQGVGFFKPEKGTNEIMILPFTMSMKNMEGVDADTPWYRMQVLKHFRIGAEDKSFICPRTIGKKCPICEHRAALLANGRDTQDEEVKALTARKRDIFNVLDMNDEDAGIKIWEVSYHNFGAKLEEEIRESDDDPDKSHYAAFADPDEGSVLSIRMKQATIGQQKFLECSRIDFNQIDEPLSDDILDSVVPLDQCLVVLPYDELKRIFYDLEEPAAGDDSEDEEKPSRSSRTGRASSRSTKPADDDEDEKPQRRGASSRRPAPEPAEDDGDEEPEEKPARGRRPDPAPEEKPSRRRTAPPADDDEEPEEKPARRAGASNARRPAPEPEPQDEEGEGDGEEFVCPVRGGKFGHDCDTHPGKCENCEIWSECRDKLDAIEAEAATAKKPAARRGR